jgi:hypothetical protein
MHGGDSRRIEEDAADGSGEGGRVNSQFWIRLWRFEGSFQWVRVLERIKTKAGPTCFPCEARRTGTRMRSVGPGERNNIDWCLSLTQGKERNLTLSLVVGYESVSNRGRCIIEVILFPFLLMD